MRRTAEGCRLAAIRSTRWPTRRRRYFSKPGCDTNASPVEKCWLKCGPTRLRHQASADVLLRERRTRETINLFNGAKVLPEVTASHTIYLEELGLKPGDFVCYAKAKDNARIRAPRNRRATFTSSVRRSAGLGRAAQSMAGGGGGGGGGGAGQLSDSCGSSGRSSRRRSTSSAIKPKMSARISRQVGDWPQPARLREQVGP